MKVLDERPRMSAARPANYEVIAMAEHVRRAVLADRRRLGAKLRRLDARIAGGDAHLSGHRHSVARHLNATGGRG
jgi:chemotaxis receptor (MCP) glutamine deamidase CheD